MGLLKAIETKRHRGQLKRVIIRKWWSQGWRLARNDEHYNQSRLEKQRGSISITKWTSVSYSKSQQQYLVSTNQYLKV